MLLLDEGHGMNSPCYHMIGPCCRSNHLNGPDFDALETASVASCSSAYSSKSESSVMSPPCGSVTELSDAGSCDTFMEYDMHQRKHKVRLHAVSE